jgi:quercetin dioxygenase-like cupin family protein
MYLVVGAAGVQQIAHDDRSPSLGRSGDGTEQAVTAHPSEGFHAHRFQGGEGAWTVPHLHRHMEESFYVLDGTFTLTVGAERHEAGPGT